jgi:hypothetical protein
MLTGSPPMKPCHHHGNTASRTYVMSAATARMRACHVSQIPRRGPMNVPSWAEGPGHDVRAALARSL